MTPSGSCEIRSSSFCSTSASTVSLRSVRGASARKKSSRPSRPFSSFRDCRIGLPTSDVSVRASVSCIATTRSRKAAIVARRFLTERAAQRRLRRRAPRVLPADGRVRVGGDVGEDVAGGGVVDLHRLVATARTRPPCAAPSSRGSRRGSAYRRCTKHRPAGWNSGCHCTREHVRRAGPADRLDEAVRLGPRLDDEIAAERLHRLVMDRVRLDRRSPG